MFLFFSCHIIFLLCVNMFNRFQGKCQNDLVQISLDIECLDPTCISWSCVLCLAQHHNILQFSCLLCLLWAFLLLFSFLWSVRVHRTSVTYSFFLCQYSHPWTVCELQRFYPSPIIMNPFSLSLSHLCFIFIFLFGYKTAQVYSQTYLR